MHEAADKIEELERKAAYDRLVAIVKDAIFAECDGTYFKDSLSDFGVVLHEKSGEEIEKFAERIATEIHSKL
jgi:hypothetical protein